MATDAPDSKLLWLLEPSEVAELKRPDRIRRYPAGRTLFNQGDPSDHAVLILSGYVKVTSVGLDGREVLLARRGPQAIVGELSAIDHQRRSATVTVIEEIEAVTLTAEDLDDFLVGHPRAMRSLLVAVIGCLRDADIQQVEIGTRKVLYRVIQRLLELAEQHGDQAGQGTVIRLGISQDELARQVGAALVTTHRALRELREAGVVKTGRLHIDIPDLEVLRRRSG